MKYSKIIAGTFIDRPNRFIANVRIAGTGDSDPIVKAHVKNTGRCRELLIEGATVVLNEPASGNRATRYDVVAVYKGDRLINIDSQVLNGVFSEALPSIGLFEGISLLKGEATHGDSRFDFYLEHDGGRAYIEVKGVTLEKDGTVFFPDAPTERGIKHVRGLERCADEGYGAYLVFVIQMSDVVCLSVDGSLHPEFWDAVESAERKGVKVLAYGCEVSEDSIALGGPVPIRSRSNPTG